MTIVSFVVGFLQSGTAFATDQLTLHSGESIVLELPEPADTIVVGDPEVVQAVIQNGRTLVFSGKRLGATNFIARNELGKVIKDTQIVVGRSIANSARLFRGASMQTFRCTPFCETDQTDLNRVIGTNAN